MLDRDHTFALNLLREDIKIKKTVKRVKLASFTLPPSPPTERVKNKRMKYWYVWDPPPPQLRVKNLVVFKAYCNTFEVTFQSLEISLTSSESKQDETKLDKSNIQCR